jgi:ATP-dependent Zn protease
MTSKAKVKKIEGKINNQVFFAYVLSFEAFMNVVLNNPEIKSKNVTRTGFDAYLNKFYIVMDIFSIIVIIMIIRGSLKKAEGQLGQRMAGNMNKNKRFTVAKQTNIKFDDVAGLH